MDAPPARIVSSTSIVRVINERAVYDRLCSGGGASAAELVAATGLSKPTVTLALSSLERAGLLAQGARRIGLAGRAPRVWDVRGAAGTVLALDIGRVWSRVAVAGLDGVVLARRQAHTSRRSATRLVSETEKLADAALAAAGRGRAEITRVVLGCPGVHDRAADVIRLSPNLPALETPGVLTALRRFWPGDLSVGNDVKPSVGSDVKLSVGNDVTFSVENDVNLAALAELAGGQAGSDFVLLWVGSGLGAGLVVGGRLLRGALGAAGEIAHLPVRTGGRARARAIEAASAPEALVDRARAHGLGSVRTPRDVFAAYHVGDPAAARAVLEEAEHVATAIAAIVAVIDPAIVVLGGGIGANPDLAAPVRDRLASLVPLRVPELRTSTLGSEAPLLGALASALAGARDLAFEAASGHAPR